MKSRFAEIIGLAVLALACGAAYAEGTPEAAEATAAAAKTATTNPAIFYAIAVCMVACQPRLQWARSAPPQWAPPQRSQNCWARQLHLWDWARALPCSDS